MPYRGEGGRGQHTSAETAGELPPATLLRRESLPPTMDFPRASLPVAVPRQASQLEATYERARRFQERDDRVEIIDRDVEDHGALKLHNFYVRYLFPLMVEIQYFELHGKAAPAPV